MQLGMATRSHGVATRSHGGAHQPLVHCAEEEPCACLQLQVEHVFQAVPTHGGGAAVIDGVLALPGDMTSGVAGAGCVEASSGRRCYCIVHVVHLLRGLSLRGTWLQRFCHGAHGYRKPCTDGVEQSSMRGGGGCRSRPRPLVSVLVDAASVTATIPPLSRPRSRDRNSAALEPVSWPVSVKYCCQFWSRLW